MTDAQTGGTAHSPATAEDVADLRVKLDEVLREMKRLDTRLRTIDRRTFHLPRSLLTDIQALQQLFDRYSPEATLPEVAGWALSPRGLLALVDLIEASDATTVVECGSGTSTLWIAYALRRRGRGKVIALDHLPEYAERTQRMIDAHGLGWFAEVRLAPLVERETSRGTFRWYDVDAVSLRTPIDGLLVDGPPQSTGPHARYPALPVLGEHLSPEAWILCDDTNRQDEKEMIDYWLDEIPELKHVSTPAPDLEVLRMTRPGSPIIA